MNSTERDLRLKYRYSKTPYIYDVYEEFELRCNATKEDYEGLKRGECRFNYAKWEARLDISHKCMINAIKKLQGIDNIIVQRFKGVKGSDSIYFLLRFNEEKEEQKEAQNSEQKKEQNKTSIYNGLARVKEQKEVQNSEQKRVYTSKHNNLNIISKEIYSEIIDRFNTTCNGLSKVMKVTDKRKKAIESRLKEYDQEVIYKVFDITSNSKFLNGDNNRGWKADFDWIINPNNFIKVLEGKYNNQEQQITEKPKGKVEKIGNYEYETF